MSRLDPDIVEGKMAATEVPSSAEVKKKDQDLPMKPKSCNMIESSALCVSSGINWPERSPQPYIGILGGHCSKRYVTSSVETGAPSTNISPMTDAGLVIEELASINYRTPNLDSVSPSNISEGMHSVLSQRQLQYQLAGGQCSTHTDEDFGSTENDLRLFSAREDLRKSHFAVKDFTLSSKQSNLDPADLCAYFTDGYGKLNLGNTNRTKILSTSSFSQIFANKYMKGKGVISRRIEAPNELRVVAEGQNTEQVFESRLLSDTNLNSSGKNGNFSQHIIERGGFEPCHDGIILREWLKRDCHKVNKVERLLLFRQIVQLVDFAHSHQVALLDLRPSYFTLLPSMRVKYIGSSRLVHQRECGSAYQDINRKRPLEQELHTGSNLGVKLQRFGEEMRHTGHQTLFTSGGGTVGKAMSNVGTTVNDRQGSGYTELEAQNISRYQSTCLRMQHLSNSPHVQLEKKWYATPEELGEKGMFSSNIYSLGILLFELLCCFESSEVHFVAMLELRDRIFPPHFLSENPKETAFCLWLLQPDSSSRPTAREILKSGLVCGYEEFSPGDDLSSWFDNKDDTESELLIHFLHSLEEEKHNNASTLAQDIGCLEADIKEIERRHIKSTSSYSLDKDLPDGRKCCPRLEDHTDSDVLSKSFIMSNMVDRKLMRNLTELEAAYFFMRSHAQLTDNGSTERVDKDLLRKRERWSMLQNGNNEHSMEGKPLSHLKAFSEGLCKFVRHNKFQVCGTLRNGGLLNSANVTCSLSFDRDEDYIAAAGVSKKIKIFEFGALLNDSVDIHYPVAEMTNKSKLSCVCWNSYIRNYLASTDYDGVVQIWDASTGQGFMQFVEHQKRAWSVDFSQVHPKKLASGSDDCCVKLWSINEKNSVSKIWGPANVCCVQFSAYSSHLLAFGSADYKIYCYDVRNTRIPWCTLAGHGKAVSYVKFLDSKTLVSSSTDNTLKLWDLKKTNLEGLSSGACTLTFSGHANNKNFVGLSVFDGYIACGSETNEVYNYHRSLPMPVATHKFSSIDPVSGLEVGDDSGQFVSSVCWRGKSNMLVAANSSGSMKLLQMV